MKENASLLKIWSVATPPHDASDGFNCSNYEKGKKLEIAQITAFSCLSAGCLLTAAKIQRIIASGHGGLAAGEKYFLKSHCSVMQFHPALNARNVKEEIRNPLLGMEMNL